MTWSSILCIVIATVVLVLLIWGVNKLALWISVKFEGTKFAQISLKVSSVITRAVKATYQTYVQGIKGTDAWTEDAQKKALTDALNTAKSQLTQEAIEQIEKNYGDVDKYLESEVESTLYDLKNKPTTNGDG